MKGSERTKLRDYRAKRDFSRTTEPSASKARSRKRGPLRFVVQMHRATRLHFDFRLEAGGTLKSWAVPKGPSMDPADKRLAMHVEDHPLDYAGFEGQIPKGNYGAGEVIVWDNGTYELLEGDDPVRAIEKGSLKFAMHGKKLRGAFALVKMRARDGSDNAWLLIKERDQYAKPGNASRDDRSVLSKRTLSEVAKSTSERTWQSNRSAKPSPSRARRVRAAPVVELKRPNKVLYPDDDYTKADLAAYYDAVAEWMLPHVVDRPLSVQRYPDGIAKPSFFEKHVPRTAPEWLATVDVAGAQPGAKVRYLLCNDKPTLAYLANLAAIVLHVWTSRVDALDEPDCVFFDLDPGEKCPLRRLAAVALQLRKLLVQIKLTPLIKTSGGSGFHVLVPLEGGYSYPIVKTFGELVARQLEQEVPDDVTLERSMSKRPAASVYFDHAQIGRGKTMVAAYSPRAAAGAPVSMPLAWAEVNRLLASRARDARSFFANWTIRTVPKLLKRSGDPWKGAFEEPQSLETAVAAVRTKWR